MEGRITLGSKKGGFGEKEYQALQALLSDTGFILPKWGTFTGTVTEVNLLLYSKEDRVSVLKKLGGSSFKDFDLDFLSVY